MTKASWAPAACGSFSNVLLFVDELTASQRGINIYNCKLIISAILKDVKHQ